MVREGLKMERDPADGECLAAFCTTIDLYSKRLNERVESCSKLTYAESADIADQHGATGGDLSCFSEGHLGHTDDQSFGDQSSSPQSSMAFISGARQWSCSTQCMPLQTIHSPHLDASRQDR